jgi:diguanylate cyclase (GGDEF)-like protein
MDESNHLILQEAAQKIRELLQGQFPPPIGCPKDARQAETTLCNQINRLIDALHEAGIFANQLSQGILHKDIPPTRNLLSSPIKELHARLLHLMWQTQQITKGDYSQRVDFMGDFSEAINTMVVGLERRDRELNAKIQELAQQKAELSALNEKLEEEIDLRIHAEKTIMHLAHHDSLTGLGNRRRLKIFYNKESALAQRYRRKMALLLMDLNKFKQVNDHLGHKAGDEVLKTIASRIKINLRRSDITCRLGGDEFVVVVSDMTQPVDVIKIADKLIYQIEKPIPYRNNTCHVGVSIGIAYYPTDGKTLDKLIKNADRAMYHVKRKGISGYQLFNQLNGN